MKTICERIERWLLPVEYCKNRGNLFYLCEYRL